MSSRSRGTLETCNNERKAVDIARGAEVNLELLFPRWWARWNVEVVRLKHHCH
jgi:hypothetical protein